MPGFLYHVGAAVLCAHGGQAQPTVPNPRVLVSGQPTVLVTDPYLIAGCALPPPTAANGPCIIAQWQNSSTRAFSNGQPFVVTSSQAICTPTGTPLVIGFTQVRVRAL